MNRRNKKQRADRTGLVLALCLMLFCWPLANCSAGSNGAQASGGDEDVSDKIARTDEEWRQLLTDEQYRVLREKGTERPFSGKYNKFYKDGTYLCAACGQELFTSDSKYDSGSGWPAFWATASEDGVASHEDRSMGMVRTEVTCSRCGQVVRDNREVTQDSNVLCKPCAEGAYFSDAKEVTWADMNWTPDQKYT